VAAKAGKSRIAETVQLFIGGEDGGLEGIRREEYDKMIQLRCIITTQDCRHCPFSGRDYSV
jgi:hypothetical protein